MISRTYLDNNLVNNQITRSKLSFVEPDLDFPVLDIPDQPLGKLPVLGAVTDEDAMCHGSLRRLKTITLR
jgi:hypothetical protein